MNFKTEWHRLKVPPFCERIIGFSVPLDGEVLVVSNEGVHLLSLDSDITVESNLESDQFDNYDPHSGIASYREKDFQIIGLHGGNPILKSPLGEILLLDNNSETLSLSQNAEVVFSMKYKNFSGDWTAVTFSPDGRYIVLGCPYDFDFVVLERI